LYIQTGTCPTGLCSRYQFNTAEWMISQIIMKLKMKESIQMDRTNIHDSNRLISKDINLSTVQICVTLTEWRCIYVRSCLSSRLDGNDYFYSLRVCTGNDAWSKSSKFYVYLSNIPAIATENLLALLLFSLFTTYFGPYGPSSGEIQLHHLHILRKPSILQRIRCFTICLLLSTLRCIQWKISFYFKMNCTII
jgi:hypothetical protein